MLRAVDASRLPDVDARALERHVETARRASERIRPVSTPLADRRATRGERAASRPRPPRRRRNDGRHVRCDVERADIIEHTRAGTADDDGADQMPMARPVAVSDTTAADDEAADGGRRRAEREAHGDLVRALADEVREHAVDADGRQRQREHAEAGHQPHRHPHRPERIVDDVGEQTHVLDGRARPELRNRRRARRRPARRRRRPRASRR